MAKKYLNLINASKNWFEIPHPGAAIYKSSILVINIKNVSLQL